MNDLHYSITGAADTAWHVFRFHMDCGSDMDRTPSLASKDGRAALWIDGNYINDSEFHVDTGEVEGWSCADLVGDRDSLMISYISLGRNKDKGGGIDTLPNGDFDVPRTESIWWGYVKLWREDPGWPMWPNDTPLVHGQGNISNWEP